jgi:hypothetical protein
MAPVIMAYQFRFYWLGSHAFSDARNRQGTDQIA